MFFPKCVPSLFENENAFLQFIVNWELSKVYDENCSPLQQISLLALKFCSFKMLSEQKEVNRILMISLEENGAHANVLFSSLKYNDLLSRHVANSEQQREPGAARVSRAVDELSRTGMYGEVAFSQWRCAKNGRSSRCWLHDLYCDDRIDYTKGNLVICSIEMCSRVFNAVVGYLPEFYSESGTKIEYF